MFHFAQREVDIPILETCPVAGPVLKGDMQRIGPRPDPELVSGFVLKRLKAFPNIRMPAKLLVCPMLKPLHLALLLPVGEEVRYANQQRRFANRKTDGIAVFADDPDRYVQGIYL